MGCVLVFYYYVTNDSKTAAETYLTIFVDQESERCLAVSSASGSLLFSH